MGSAVKACKAMKRWCAASAFTTSLVAGHSLALAAQEESELAIPASFYHTVYATDWSGGIDAAIGMQSPEPGAVSVVSDPVSHQRKAVRVSIARDQIYAGVANGSPRAELVFSNLVRFEVGRDYLIQWSTYLPASFEFDTAQMQVITQIHQGVASGPPPIMLTLSGSDYTFSERGGEHTEHGRGPRICCAAQDRGKWVHWALRYVPDSSGRQAVTQLWKDGRPVYLAGGAPNAYPDDRQAYLKLGLYKPGWHLQPSHVNTLMLLYGPVSVGVK
jgi:Polysaccharide lyase